MPLIEVMPLAAVGGAVMFVLIATAWGGDTLPHGWLLPAGLSAAFFAWSLWAVAKEGPLGFWAVHTTSLWGNQVWFDLLLAVSIGWWLALPRLRAAGMNAWGWLLPIVTTGCIGFFAMIARLMYLSEKARQERAPL